MWIFISPSYAYAAKNAMRESIDDVKGKGGQKEYSFDVGAQIGGGYYLGDANRIPFMNPRYVLGAQIRYKFDKRWSIQFKVQRQCIAYNYALKNVETQLPENLVKYQNPIWHGDIVGEFNFFNFGAASYDYRIKTISPYLFIGAGVSVFNKVASPIEEGKNNIFPIVDVKAMNIAMYVPIGIGFKWKFASRWQLQVAWQHNIYLADNVEGYLPGIDYKNDDELLDISHGILNNSNEMNGINIFNNDVISTLTIGVVYEFGSQKYKKYINESTATSARIRRGFVME